MQWSQPTSNRSADIFRRIKDGRRHGSQSLLWATRNDLLLPVGWKVQYFSDRDFCDHESDRIVKTMKKEITQPVNSYVDSQAALKTIEASTLNSEVILRCRTALGNLHTSLRLCWVSGHHHIKGNGKVHVSAWMDTHLTGFEVAETLKPLFVILPEH